MSRYNGQTASNYSPALGAYLSMKAKEIKMAESNAADVLTLWVSNDKVTLKVFPPRTYEEFYFMWFPALSTYFQKVSPMPRKYKPVPKRWSMCVQCGHAFLGRADKLTCSPLCRKHKSRQAHRLNRESQGPQVTIH